MPSAHLIRDIETHRVPEKVLLSPRLGAHLLAEAQEVAQLYRARVAKRTGRLAASATAHVQVGGHKHDRLIGKVIVGTGLEYAALHEFGAPSNPARQAAKDLAEAVAAWKGSR